MLLHRRADPLVCVQGGSWNLHGLPYDGRRTRKGKLASIFAALVLRLAVG